MRPILLDPGSSTDEALIGTASVAIYSPMEVVTIWARLLACTEVCKGQVLPCPWSTIYGMRLHALLQALGGLQLMRSADDKHYPQPVGPEK